MTGFELRTSGVGSNRSTNWTTTTALVATLCSYPGDITKFSSKNEKDQIEKNQRHLVEFDLAGLRYFQH